MGEEEDKMETTTHKEKSVHDAPEYMLVDINVPKSIDDDSPVGIINQKQIVYGDLICCICDCPKFYPMKPLCPCPESNSICINCAVKLKERRKEKRCIFCNKNEKDLHGQKLWPVNIVDAIQEPLHVLVVLHCTHDSKYAECKKLTET